MAAYNWMPLLSFPPENFQSTSPPLLLPSYSPLTPLLLALLLPSSLWYSYMISECRTPEAPRMLNPHHKNTKLTSPNFSRALPPQPLPRSLPSDPQATLRTRAPLCPHAQSCASRPCSILVLVYTCSTPPSLLLPSSCDVECQFFSLFVLIWSNLI